MNGSGNGSICVVETWGLMPVICVFQTQIIFSCVDITKKIGVWLGPAGRLRRVHAAIRSHTLDGGTTRGKVSWAGEIGGQCHHHRTLNADTNSDD